MDIRFLLNPEPQIQTPSELSNSDVLQPLRLDCGQLNSALALKPGRPARSISDRSALTFGKPQHQIQRSYSREFKITVLEWWFHHRIPQSVTEFNRQGLRAPLLKEVAARYLVPISTLQSWRANQDKIIASKKGSRKSKTAAQRCHWPELEADLYEKYRKRREERKAVRRNWLMRQACESYTQCYGEPSANSQLEEFRFSNGWLFGFLGRHAITLRFATNKSQKIPENYLQSILSWLRFNRPNSQPLPTPLLFDPEHTVGQSHLAIPEGLASLEGQNLNNIRRIFSAQRVIWDNRSGFGANQVGIRGISSGMAEISVEHHLGDYNETVGRYLLDSICNVDETPLPFEFLDGQTYADKGSRSVQVKASNSGWDKRQATLVLTIFGSGRPRVRPLIIFKGKEKYEGRRSQFYQQKREQEEARYDIRVAVHWNETAYANSDLLIDWIENLLVPALPPGSRLLALDVAKFHSMEGVLSTLRSHNIIPSLIPPGCTGLVQPLDVSVNKPFKSLLRDILDNLLDQYQDIHHINLREIQRSNSSAIAERRVLVTQAVGAAWEQFCEKHQGLVVSTFRKLGLTLPIDGSSDEELSVKGIDSSLLEIGDWRRDENSILSQEDGLGSLDGEPVEHGIEFVDRE